MSFYLPRQIQEIEEFLDLEAIENEFVLGGTVRWANHEALRRDFAFLNQLTDSEIDSWIVSEFSYIAKLQHKLVGLRCLPYQVSGKTKTTFREKQDGRADTVIVRDLKGESAGLISRKGVGISQVKLDRNHEILRIYKERGMTEIDGVIKLRGMLNSNGMEVLGEAIREVAVLEALRMVYDILYWEKNFRFESVESYFILELPVQVYRKEGMTPARTAVYGRQANYGRIWSNNLPYRESINAKQLDFTGSSVDGGTVKLDASLISTAPLLLEEFKKVSDLSVCQEIVEQLKSNPRAVYDYIDFIVAPIKNKWLQASSVAKTPFTKIESVERILDLLLEDPLTRSSLAVLLLTAQEKKIQWILQHPKAQLCMEKLVLVDPTIVDENYPHIYKTDGLAPQDHPLRRWGLLLLPSLKNKELVLETIRSVHRTRPQDLVYLTEVLKYFSDELKLEVSCRLT